ncbi:uncharacterized protein LOC144713565 isoform X2 [Wolffia australiana]
MEKLPPLSTSPRRGRNATDAKKKNMTNRKNMKKKNAKSKAEEEISTIEEREEDPGKKGCGIVTELDCMIFPESGKFRGIAIVSFEMKAAAKRALALDGSYRSWWEGRGCICLQMLTPRRQHRGE